MATARLTAGRSEKPLKYARALMQQHSRRPKAFGALRCAPLLCTMALETTRRFPLEAAACTIPRVWWDLSMACKPAQSTPSGAVLHWDVHTYCNELHFRCNQRSNDESAAQRPLGAVFGCSAGMGARHRNTPPPSPPPLPQETFFVPAPPPPSHPDPGSPDRPVRHRGIPWHGNLETETLKHLFAVFVQAQHHS